MEMIPISRSKLKIMLDESDMKEYNIGKEADCANNETRHAIRNILDMAKSRIGFNTEGEEIFVQLYTSKTGGCELFVTKSGMSDNTPDHDIKNDKKPRKRETTAKSAEICTALSQRKDDTAKNEKHEYGRLIYSFESIHLLCLVCKILFSKNVKYTSHAYSDLQGSYYLVIDNTGASAYSRLCPLSFIAEYGKRERSDHALTYLNEYGKIICNDRAIETLSQF